MVFLFIADMISYNYLKLISENKIPYRFIPSIKSFIYQKKDIVIDDPKDFNLEDFFVIVGFKDSIYRYEFKDDVLQIELDGKTYHYDYELRQPVVEIVEKTVYKEVVKEVKVSEPQQQEDDDERKESSGEYLYEEDYFRLRKDKAIFDEGEDISKIIEVIKDQADTNMQVTIDYSQLNPNIIGQYTVYFIAGNQKYPFLVEIV